MKMTYYQLVLEKNVLMYFQREESNKEQYLQLSVHKSNNLEEMNKYLEKHNLSKLKLG